MKSTTIVLTCEHAVNTIPAKYQHCFKGHEKVLNTHRAIDFGALEMAEQFKLALKKPLFTATCSRILIECNRSLNNAKCFSEFSNTLSADEKKNLIEQYYQPYRQEVIAHIKNIIDSGSHVLHLSMHSFTPEFNGIKREADIGLLYDPKRKSEKDFIQKWQKSLKEQSKYRVRKNYPYVGYSDGFTTSLRKLFPENYSGIEVEVNQAIMTVPETLKKVTEVLISSLPY